MTEPTDEKRPKALGFVSCETCPHAPAENKCVTFCRLITRRFRAGDIVYRLGENADYVWFVKEGVIGLAMSAGDSPTHLQQSGGWIGAQAAPDGTYPRTAIVLVNATLCGQPRSEFDAGKDHKETT